MAEDFTGFVSGGAKPTLGLANNLVLPDLDSFALGLGGFDFVMLIT